MIPFQDLGRLHEGIASELDEAVRGVVIDGAFIGGQRVAAFEAAFAEAHGAPGAVSCGSGTDALTLALLAAGLEPGDEVIVPSMTFFATAEAIIHAGGRPIIADVDPDTLLLSQETVATVRTRTTRAVMPVHLYGHVVPTADLRVWRDSGLLVVEDAAQAHLARYGQDGVGTIGHAACFSFYPGKNLGAFGDGGAVIAQDRRLLEQVAMLRDHGRREKYLHERIGYCSRLDTLQAAVLAVKLKHLPMWTAQRQQVAGRYAENARRSGIDLVSWVEGAVHHLLVARVPAGVRDSLREKLALAGIGTGVHYPVALSQQPALRASGAATPNAKAAAAEVVSLPMDPLMSLDEVDTVCIALEQALEASPA